MPPWRCSASPGFARAKIDDVARLAGVSKGTVYLYYDSKEALFREMVRAKVVAWLAEARGARARRTRDRHASSWSSWSAAMYVRMREERMTRIARVVQAELMQFPELARFYFDEVILRARRLIEQVLERGTADGEFRPSPHALRRARALLAARPHRPRAVLLPPIRSRRRSATSRRWRGCIDLYLHGVLARPAGRS